MPWHTPITWTVGQYVTALDLNQQIRDNLNHVKGRIDLGFPAANQTVAAGTWTTTSATFSDIGSFSLTYSYASSHNLLMWFVSRAKLTAAGNIGRLDFNIDGTRIGHTAEGWQNYYIDNAGMVNARIPFVAIALWSIAAGTHTVKPQFAAHGTFELGYGVTQFGYQVLGLIL